LWFTPSIINPAALSRMAASSATAMLGVLTST
jgi:hypothetical protein